MSVKLIAIVGGQNDEEAKHLSLGTTICFRDWTWTSESIW